ncbi:MAG: ABC transporter permease, partial [Armatimonadetes bacterium]|nr:ABC transporter permease [Candidatus Hippobium faecium]
FFETLGNTFVILFKTFVLIFSGKINIKDTLNQMYFIGIESLPMVLLTVAFSSGVIALYLGKIMVPWGLGSYSGGVVALCVFRELSPVLVGVVLSARVASSIGAEIGTMKVSEQIDALQTLSVSPLEYLVVPKVLGGIVIAPFLCILGDFVGLLAGFLVALSCGVADGGFISTCQSFAKANDINMGIIKTLFYACAVTVIGSQQGLRTKGGAVGVGQATTNAVVIATVTTYVINFLLTYIMFG